MSGPIVYIDSSEILGGKLEPLKAAIDELVAFIMANEPQLIAYNFHIDEDDSRMTVVAVHPDAASLAFHMQVAGPLFGKFRELIRLSSIQVYGELTGELHEQLRKKAELLGQGKLLVHPRYAGFARFGASC